MLLFNIEPSHNDTEIGALDSRKIELFFSQEKRKKEKKKMYLYELIMLN